MEELSKAEAKEAVKQAKGGSRRGSVAAASDEGGRRGSVAEASDAAAEGTPTKKAWFRAVAATVLREGLEIDSDRCGVVHKGAIVVARGGVAMTAAGIPRIRTDKGWITVQSADGVVVMEELSKAEAKEAVKQAGGQVKAKKDRKGSKSPR